MTQIALVGCGYVADFYMRTLPLHPELTLAGVYDKDSDRLQQFCDHWGVASFGSFEELLGDPDVAVVANLTNPRSHYEVTAACLRADKHVYSEKPVAMGHADAAELAELAAASGLLLSAAPCSLLGETAQTMWKAVRDGVVGDVRLVYANLDDGMVHLKRPATSWRSESGAPWPARDEFEVGCTFEHAGYYVSWLAAMFGSASRVHSYSTTAIEDKGVAVEAMAPDFSVGILEFEAGVTARITCSVVAPIDRSLVVIGDLGAMWTDEAWDIGGRVKFRPHAEARWRRGLRRFAGLDMAQSVPLVRRSRLPRGGMSFPMDFSAGIADLARAVEAGGRPLLTSDLAVHVAEITEALQHPDRFSSPKALVSRVGELSPAPWGQ